MNALLHWYETNPGMRPQPATKPSGRGRGDYHHGPRAVIVYEGVTYNTWREACEATGKTKDTIRWGIRLALKMTKRNKS